MTATDINAIITQARIALIYNLADVEARTVLADAYEDAGESGLAAVQRRLLKAGVQARFGSADRADIRQDIAYHHEIENLDHILVVSDLNEEYLCHVWAAEVLDRPSANEGWTVAAANEGDLTVQTLEALDR